MCTVKMPSTASIAATSPASTPIPDRQAAISPDSGDTNTRTKQQILKRLGMAASIFTPQNGSLGAPSVTGTMKSNLGV